MEMKCIMEATHAGQPRDGVVIILPMEKFYHVRTKSEVAAESA